MSEKLKEIDSQIEAKTHELEVINNGIKNANQKRVELTENNEKLLKNNSDVRYFIKHKGEMNDIIHRLAKDLQKVQNELDQKNLDRNDLIKKIEELQNDLNGLSLVALKESEKIKVDRSNWESSGAEYDRKVFESNRIVKELAKKADDLKKEIADFDKASIKRKETDDSEKTQFLKIKKERDGEINDFNLKLDKVKTSVRGVEKQLDSKSKELSKVETRLNEFKRTFLQLLQTLESERKDRAIREKKFEELVSGKKRSLKDLQLKSEELKKETARIDEIRQTRQLEELSLNELIDRIKVLSGSRDSMLRELSSYHKLVNLKVADEELNKIKDKKQFYQDKINEYENELISLRFEALRQVQGLNKDSDKWQSQVASYDQVISLRKKEISDLDIKLDKIRKEANKLEELKSLRIKAENEIKDLDNYIKTLSSSKSALAREVKKLEEKRDKENKQVVDIKNLAEEAINSILQIHKDTQDYRDKIHFYVRRIVKHYREQGRREPEVFKDFKPIVFLRTDVLKKLKQLSNKNV